MEQVAAKGHQVFERLQSLPSWHAARCVALYAAQTFEVPTAQPLQALLQLKKRLCFPSSFSSFPSLALVHAWDDLEADSYGILCPKAYCPPVSMAEVELVVVPGVAFAKNGARLGRGGGFYDRLLAHPEMRALRVGLCFDECLRESLPEEEGDQRMDWVISDQQSLLCRAASP